MSLIRRQKELKTHSIAGEDFYSLPDAARRLGFSRAKLSAGLRSRRFSFRWAKDGDTLTSRIFVSAKDVEVFIRQQERAFQRRLELNALV